MTLDELAAREAIRDTLARYNTSGDRLRAEDFAACFTSDGVIESDDRTEDHTWRYAGRPAILAWQSAWRNREPAAKTAPGPSFVRHHLTTCRIDLTGPDTARVLTYFSVMSDNGPDHAGTYLDTFRVEHGAWLIAHRRVRIDWRSPHSLFHPDR
jgi:hypothetical protein